MKRLVYVLFLVLFWASPSFSQSNLATIAASLSAGQWARFPSASMTNWNMGEALSSNGLPPCSTDGPMIAYQDKGQWDPIHREIRFLGNDHSGGCYGGWHVKFTDSTSTWSHDSWPDDLCQYAGDTTTPTSDCTTPFAHAYEYNAMNPATGDLYFHQYNGRHVYKYTRATNTWSDMPDVSTASTDFAVAMEYVPGYGLIFISGQFGIWHLNFAENAWTQLADTHYPATSGMLPQYDLGHPWAHWDNKDGLLIFGGDDFAYTMDITGAITTKTAPPISMGVTTTALTAIDPVSGKLIFIHNNPDYSTWSSFDAMYIFDAIANTWTSVTNTVPSDFLGPYCIAVAVPTYGVIVYLSSFGVTGDNSRVYVYKLTNSDFTSKCSVSGVVKCVTFDTDADFSHGSGTSSGAYGENSGIIPPFGTTDFTKGIRDTTEKASGASSLKFTIPAVAGADTSGSWFTNFSTDLATQFGAGQTFYVQWRQKFSSDFLANAYMSSEGWKQAIIGTGDIMGTPYSSCSDLEVVMQNSNLRGFSQMYNSCSGSSSHGGFDPFEESVGGEIRLQNARITPYCLYSQLPSNIFPPNGNCFGYTAGEWMTFQEELILGSRSGNEFINSYVKVWLAREGRPSELVFNWGPYNLSAGAAVDNQKFGKIWFLPYQTNKDGSASYPVAYTWYDDLVISTNKISDPTITNETSTPSTGSGAHIRLRVR